MSLVILRNELILVWGRGGVVLCFSFIYKQTASKTFEC